MERYDKCSTFKENPVKDYNSLIGIFESKQLKFGSNMYCFIPDIQEHIMTTSVHVITSKSLEAKMLNES